MARLLSASLACGMRVFVPTVKRSCSSSDLLIFQVWTANIGDGFIGTPKWQNGKLHYREGQLCILCVLEAGRHSEYIGVVGCFFAPFFGGNRRTSLFCGIQP